MLDCTVAVMGGQAPFYAGGVVPEGLTVVFPCGSDFTAAVSFKLCVCVGPCVWPCFDSDVRMRSVLSPHATQHTHARTANTNARTSLSALGPSRFEPLGTMRILPVSLAYTYEAWMCAQLRPQLLPQLLPPLSADMHIRCLSWPWTCYCATEWRGAWVMWCTRLSCRWWVQHPLMALLQSLDKCRW